MSEEVEIVNAKIKDVEIEFTHGAFLTAWVHLDYGGFGQGFGGYCLGVTDSNANQNACNIAGEFITRVMECADVDRWSHCKGKIIRVRRGKGLGGMIQRIGHPTDDDIWFEPEYNAVFQKAKERQE